MVCWSSSFVCKIEGRGEWRNSLTAIKMSGRHGRGCFVVVVASACPHRTAIRRPWFIHDERTRLHLDTAKFYLIGTPPPPLNMNAPPKTYTEPQAAFQELLFWGLYNSWIELNFCQVREYPRTCMLTYADSIHGNRQCTTLVQNHKIMVVKNLQRNWQKYDGYWKHDLIPILLLILYKIFILWRGIFFWNYCFLFWELFFFSICFCLCCFRFCFYFWCFYFWCFYFWYICFCCFCFCICWFCFCCFCFYCFCFCYFYICFYFCFCYFCFYINFYFCYFLLIYCFWLFLCCIGFFFVFMFIL